MISLDQVLLLQEKVETAVSRIAALSGEVRQLKAENAALRTKCTELTNALSVKTELVSSMESEQDKIETSILNALNRLDTVENSILTSSAGSNLSFNSNSSNKEEPVEQEKAEPQQEAEIDLPVSPVASSSPAPQSALVNSTDTSFNSVPPESKPLSGNFDIF